MANIVPPEILAALKLAANINPFGSVENAKARDAAIAVLANSQAINFAQVAWQLERTAMGDGYYGEALRTAKSLPGVSDDERALLDRYATGDDSDTDYILLQVLALKIDAMDRTP